MSVRPAAVRRVLRAPSSNLGRIRWFFLIFVVFFAVTFPPQILVAYERPLPLRWAATGALLGLALWWVRCYRRGVFPMWALPLEAGVFVLCGLAPDDPYKSLGLLYISVNFRSLYGTWRQVLAFLLTALVAFSLGMVLAHEVLRAQDRLGEALQTIPGVPVLAAITYLMALSLARAERSTVREQVLSRTGIEVALASDHRGLEATAERAGGALLGDDRAGRVRLVLASDQHTGGTDGPTDSHVDSHVDQVRLALPLRTREGLTGALQVLGDQPVPGEAVDALRTLASQLALGLDNVALTEDLRHRATHDALTGLANRSLLADTVRRAVDDARNGAVVAVLLLDLDGFKQVNDGLGHAAGDGLLVAVADRLREAVRERDLVGRLGGDEFAVLLDGLDGPAEADDIAERLLEAVTRPLVLCGREVEVGASVGVAVWTGQADAEELLRDADSAMYVAKSGGKGRVRSYPVPA